jgi:hypothetical protein
MKEPLLRLRTTLEEKRLGYKSLICCLDVNRLVAGKGGLYAGSFICQARVWKFSV